MFEATVFIFCAGVGYRTTKGHDRQPTKVGQHSKCLPINVGQQIMSHDQLLWPIFTANSSAVVWTKWTFLPNDSYFFRRRSVNIFFNAGSGAKKKKKEKNSVDAIVDITSVFQVCNIGPNCKCV